MSQQGNNRSDTHRAAFLARLQREQEYIEVVLPEIRKKGEGALRELLPIALKDTGQSDVIAKFLLGLYSGERFPFDLTEFRRLDRDLFNKCQQVLAMDFTPEQEVHQYFEDGCRIFESLADAWFPSDSNATTPIDRIE